ncbi:MAG: hypothetical protein [Caudoviricetes sp.]|nr:MAG: hypothetical protein [Caudoviricetes sp.]
MAATTYGVTEKGFVRKPLSVILDNLNSKFQAKFGAAFDVSPESPDGQIIGVVADEINSCWEQAQFGFNAYRPGAMEGVGLDAICELTGTERYVNRPTRVTCQCTGTQGTVVPAGSLVGDTTGLTFATVTDVTLPGDVTVACTTQGEFYVAPNTITKIITTGITGWTGVTNPDEGITGLTYESDPSLRARRDKTTVSNGTATTEAIYSALSDLDLSYVRIRDNDTGAAIGSQPAGTIFVVVDGGTLNDIARRIYDNKTGGVPTYGSQSIVINDSKGYPHTIKFSRSTPQSIYITGTFRRMAGSNLASNDVITTLQQACLDYINNLNPGEPVVWSYLFNPLVTSTPGIEIDSLFIGIAANPTATTTIPLDIDKRANTVAANCKFTEVTTP